MACMIENSLEAWIDREVVDFLRRSGRSESYHDIGVHIMRVCGLQRGNPACIAGQAVRRLESRGIVRRWRGDFHSRAALVQAPIAYGAP